MIDDLKIYNRTVDYTNTDMDSGSFTIPSSSISNFNTDSITNNQAYYSNDKDGTYYTWYTVTAGSGNANINSYQDAPYSICPKNWHLPTGGNKGNDEIAKLCTAYGNSSSVLYATPIPGFLKTGHIYWAARLTEYNSDGHYWTSTATSDVNAGFLQISTCNTYVSYKRATGVTARCIAD